LSSFAAVAPLAVLLGAGCGAGSDSPSDSGDGGPTTPSSTTPPATTTPPGNGGPPPTTSPPPATTTPPADAGTTPPATTPPPVTTPPSSGNKIDYVFVVTLENKPSSEIYGSSKAPYLNSLIAQSARSDAFGDELPDAIPSEPHYVWMEAGTNAFSDATFKTDSDPSASNSTKNTAHLGTQMNAAGVTWMGYMEGLSSSTGACPVRSSGFYAAKHDPFVFFQDIAGSPPSPTNALCAAHHAAYTPASFAQALSSGTVAQYAFVTPNLCNDMHGGSGCPSTDPITVGDQWLQANLPPMIAFANAHNGVIFLVWDEPEGGSAVMPFVAVGPHVKPGYVGKVAYNHSSLLKSIEEIFGLPILPTVAGASDLADLFQPGFFP